MHFIHDGITLRRLWLITLSAMMITSLTIAPSVAAQTDDAPQVSVLSPALNVRSGPGVAYAVLDVLLEGEQVEIVGRHSPSGWWQVRLTDGGTGWVTGKTTYIQVSGDVTGVPEAAPSAAPASALPIPTQSAETGTVAGPGGKGIIVFQTSSGGPIYVVNSDGSNLRYLTTGMDPALSPDGRQVAFTRWRGSEHGTPGNLWVINVDGSGERAILNDVSQPKAPVWSPDGSQIAISMQSGGRLAPEYKCSQSLPSDPLIADEDGDYFKVKVFVDEDGEVDVKLCYTLLPHPFWGLELVDVASGQFQELPRDLFSYAPTWDPANAWRLVYDGERGLVNLDLNQGTTWALTQDPRDHSPAFSPDGTRLAVAYLQQDHWDIHVMNADGSGRVRLTETPLRAIAEQRIQGKEPRSWNNTAPAWSPDGSQIAFLTDRNGQWEIWVMNSDGSGQQPLFPNGLPQGVTLEYYSVGERVLSWR